MGIAALHAILRPCFAVVSMWMGALIADEVRSYRQARRQVVREQARSYEVPNAHSTFGFGSYFSSETSKHSDRPVQEASLKRSFRG